MLSNSFLISCFIAIILAILFVRPKISFPIYLILILIINYELRTSGYQEHSIKAQALISYSSIFILLYFCWRFNNISKRELKPYYPIIYLLLAYLLFILIKAILLSLSGKLLIKCFFPLYHQIAMLAVIMYILRYKDTKMLFEFFFIGINIFLFRAIYFAFVKGFAIFHDANIAMAASINILLYFFYLPYQTSFKYKITKILFRFKTIFIVISFAMPFLGMGRGGIIAVTIPVILQSTLNFQKRFFKIIFVITLLITSLLIINDYIFEIIPKSLIYKHQGAANLVELFNKTQDVTTTISTRFYRWDVLKKEFTDNYILGGTGFRDPVLGDINEGFTAWGAHNYFYAIAAGGGLLLLIPTLLFYIFIFRRAYKSFRKGLHPLKLLGIGLILNGININLTNCYYYGFYSAFIIWVSMGIGIYFLTNTDMLQENV